VVLVFFVDVIASYLYVYRLKNHLFMVDEAAERVGVGVPPRWGSGSVLYCISQCFRTGLTHAAPTALKKAQFSRSLFSPRVASRSPIMSCYERFAQERHFATPV